MRRNKGEIALRLPIPLWNKCRHNSDIGLHTTIYCFKMTKESGFPCQYESIMEQVIFSQRVGQHGLKAAPLTAIKQTIRHVTFQIVLCLHLFTILPSAQTVHPSPRNAAHRRTKRRCGNSRALWNRPNCPVLAATGLKSTVTV